MVAARRRRVHRRGPEDQSVGKFSKKDLRDQFADYELPTPDVRRTLSVSWRFAVDPSGSSATWPWRARGDDGAARVLAAAAPRREARRQGHGRGAPAGARGRRGRRRARGRRSATRRSTRCSPAVTATGAYADDDTFVVENRTLQRRLRRLGAHAAAARRTARAVVVNRGFLGFDRDGAIAPPAAPVGRGGRRRAAARERAARAASVPPTRRRATLDVLARVDLDRVRRSRSTTTCCPRTCSGRAATPRRSRRRRRPRSCRSAARAVRGPAPRLRGAVVHLHDHRGGRLRAARSAGSRATRPGRGGRDGSAWTMRRSSPMRPCSCDRCRTLAVDGETQPSYCLSDAAPRPPSTRLRRPLERRLVAAMLECIGRWGVAKTTADDIARAAGVSPGHPLPRLPRRQGRRLRGAAAPRAEPLLRARRGPLPRGRHARGPPRGRRRRGGRLPARATRPSATSSRHEPDGCSRAYGHLAAAASAIATGFLAPHLARFVARPAPRRRGRRARRPPRCSPTPPTPARRVDLTDPDSVRRFVRTFVTPALTHKEP